MEYVQEEGLPTQNLVKEDNKRVFEYFRFIYVNPDHKQLLSEAGLLENRHLNNTTSGLNRVQVFPREFFSPLVNFI